MKTSINRAWTVITVVVLLSVIGLFGPESIWLGTEEAYAQERGEQRGDYLYCPDACNVWYIYLNDFGYSDALFYSFPPGNDHEMLSGEWAAAIYYDQIESAPDAMWLTDQFICPNFQTNSNFWVVSPMQPSGPNQVSSVIQNPEVRIEITATMYCSQTAMGLIADPNTGAFVPSDSCFMVQTYRITNISDDPIDSLIFYQFLHGHPGDQYGPVVRGVYDSDFYPIYDPEFEHSEDYHYDITLWTDVTWGDKTYTEYIGFGGIEQPTKYDVWYFRNPNPDDPNETGCGGGYPAHGLHVRVENQNLQNVSSWGPDQTAGVEAWFLGTLPADETAGVSVLLSVAAVEKPDRIPTLTEWGLIIFCVLLFGWMAWVIVRRRRRVTVGI